MTLTAETERPAPKAPLTAPEPLVFEESDIPNRTRAASANPYLEAVQAILGREKSLTVTLPTVDDKEVRAAVSLLTKAGQAATPPVSVRRTITKAGQTTRITFWTRPLITHKKEEPAVEAAPKPTPKAPKK